MQADDGNDASPPITNSGIGSSEVRSLPGLDITGLAASPLTFPGGLACHGRSNQLMGENVMSLLTVVSRQNVVRGDDLKVGPTECFFLGFWFVMPPHSAFCKLGSFFQFFFFS